MEIIPQHRSDVDKHSKRTDTDCSDDIAQLQAQFLNQHKFDVQSIDAQILSELKQLNKQITQLIAHITSL